MLAIHARKIFGYHQWGREIATSSIHYLLCTLWMCLLMLPTEDARQHTALPGKQMYTWDHRAQGTSRGNESQLQPPCPAQRQQLYLCTWMLQSQTYQQHRRPRDPSTLSGQGKYQQLRKPQLLAPLTFLKCRQRRALDTAKRKHCNCKSLLDFGRVWLWCMSPPNILFGDGDSSVLARDVRHYPDRICV